MECTVKISATLDQARFCTITAAHIARTCSLLFSGKTCEAENQFVNSVELAVGEACTNSVKHQTAIRRTPPELKVVFKLVDDTLVIDVCDRNAPFLFDGQPEPDVHLMQESGYGIQIIKKSMDSVNYNRSQGCNVLTMKKRLP